MQEITYATKSFVTTDAISNALVRLVTSIRRDTHSEAVTVPAYTPEGRRVEATMTLDASSELVTVPADVEMTNDTANDDAISAALADIERRISREDRETKAVYPDNIEPSSYADEY